MGRTIAQAELDQVAALGDVVAHVSRARACPKVL